MTHTVDTLMALADTYAQADSVETLSCINDTQEDFTLAIKDRQQAKEALRTALMEALQPVREPSPGACKTCGNEYLASRTDVYKDKRPFIYCDCCGAMADSKTWYLTHGIGSDK